MSSAWRKTRKIVGNLPVTSNASCSGLPGTIETFDVSSGEIVDSIGEGLAGVLSPDGRFLIFSTDVQGNIDLWYRDLQNHSAPVSLLATSSNEDDAAFSPDGSWFAYVSNTSGQEQIYVRRFPDARDPIQVSVSGGWYPRWDPMGAKLYWTSDSAVYAANIEWGSQPTFSVPQIALDAARLKLKMFSRYSATGSARIGISPDGSRFVASAYMGEVKQRPRLVLLRNWMSDPEGKQ